MAETAHVPTPSASHRVPDASEVRWLDAEEQTAWRSYISATTLLSRELEKGLLDRFDLSMDDYALLVLLSEQPERRMRMSELAADAIVPRPQVTYRITRLEKRGIVVRRPCEDDARGTYAVLTDEGFALLELAAREHVTNVRERFLDTLDRDEFLTLGATMGKVWAALATDGTCGARRA